MLRVFAVCTERVTGTSLSKTKFTWKMSAFQTAATPPSFSYVCLRVPPSDQTLHHFHALVLRKHHKQGRSSGALHLQEVSHETILPRVWRQHYPVPVDITPSATPSPNHPLGLPERPELAGGSLCSKRNGSSNHFPRQSISAEVSPPL